MGGPKKLYSNQKHVTFQNVPRNKNNPYNTYSRSALQDAMSNLSNSALRLYIYLGNYRDMQEGIYLSKQDALRKTNISDKSYFSALKELKDKGYLVKDDLWDDEDYYVFYEDPTPM